MPREWTTQTGQVVKVRDMTDGHLVNTIRLLRRWASRQPSEEAQAMMAFAEVWPLRGEMAQLCFERDLDRALTATPDDYLEAFQDGIYLVMVEEAERRGLHFEEAA